MLSAAAWHLIDEFIVHWYFFEKSHIDEFVPSLVSDPAKGDDLEKETLGKLRQLLEQEEWGDLSKLITERHAVIFHELKKKKEERERLRQEEQREKEAERRRLRQEEERKKAIRERLRQEKQRLLEGIRGRFHSDFLRADSFFQESCSALISQETDEREKISKVVD